MSKDTTMTPGESLEIEREIDRLCQSARHLEAARLATEYASRSDTSAAYLARAHYLKSYALFLGGFTIEAWDCAQDALGGADELDQATRQLILILAADIAASGRRIEEAGRLLDRLEGTGIGQLPIELQFRYYRLLLTRQEVRNRLHEIRRFIRRLKRMGDHDSAACLQTDLGKYYEIAGDPGKAAACWDAAQRMRASSPSVMADLLIQMGRHDQIYGRLQLALEQYEAAAEIGASHVQKVEALLRSAVVSWDLNQTDAAKRLMTQISSQLGDRVPDVIAPLYRFACDNIGEKPPSTLTGESEVLKEMIDVSTAGSVEIDRSRELFRRASRLLMAEMHDESVQWFRQAWNVSTKQGNHEVAWRSAVTLGRLLGDPTYRHFDSGRSVEWLANAVETLDRQSETIDVPLNKAHYRFQIRTIVSELLAHAFETGNTEQAFRYLEIVRGRLVADYFAFNQSSYKARGFRRATSLRGLSRSLANDDAYISLSVLRDHIGALVVTAARGPEIVLQELRPAELKSARARFQMEVHRQLDSYRIGKAISGAGAEFDDALMGVAKTGIGQLLEKVEERVAANNWILSVDTELATIPIHAVSVNGQRLISDHNVSYMPNAAVLLRLKNPRRIWRRSRGLVISETVESLPSAIQEATQIANRFPRSQHLSGSHATINRVLGGLNDASFVHFACHAETAGDSPLNARIHLPAGEALTAGKIAGCKIRPGSLAVLNCCRTAEQQTLISGESFSIASAFLCAGASSVIGSLWSLPDLESGQLIDRFYSRLESNPPFQSFYDMQREAISDGISPLFWAPFVMIGRGKNSSPITRLARRMMATPS